MVRSCESAVGGTAGVVAAEIFAGAPAGVGVVAGAVVPGVAVETCAGLFSCGFQWVVASVPDKFWEKFL